MKKTYILLLVTLLFLPGPSLAEEVRPDRLKVIINAMKYVRGLDKDAGVLNIGIVYDPQHATSQRQAAQFLQLLESLPPADAYAFRGKLVTVQNLKHATDLDIAHITHGLEAHFDTIFKATKALHIFTTSNDIACVKQRCCILAVSNASDVELYLNEATMRAVGFDVEAAFKFMVNRV